MASAPQTAIVCRQLLIRGIVQGVGFRPFVYNLALQHGVRGYVLVPAATMFLTLISLNFLADYIGRRFDIEC